MTVVFKIQSSGQVFNIQLRRHWHPFQEDSGYLIALDTQNTMPPSVIETVHGILMIGKTQYDVFVEERLIPLSKPANAPIKRNALPRFSQPGPKPKSATKTNIMALKNDCSLFSSLYIACQTRDGDLENFFKHENPPWPPSLSR